MKANFGLLQADMEAILQTLCKYPNVERAYIFGSRAKGNHKNGSDVDIALKGAALDFETLSQISYWLNEETTMPYRFDLVRYETIQEEALKAHIDRVGIEFYVKASE